MFLLYRFYRVLNSSTILSCHVTEMTPGIPSVTVTAFLYSWEGQRFYFLSFVRAHNVDTWPVVKTLAICEGQSSQGNAGVICIGLPYSLCFAGGRSAESRRRKRIDAPSNVMKGKSFTKRTAARPWLPVIRGKLQRTYPSIISQLISNSSLLGPQCQ